MRSLASRLLALWAMSLAACLAVALLLLQLYAQTTAAQAQRGEAVVAGACGLIRDRYAFYVAGWRGGPPDADTRAGLAAAVAFALRGQPGVEGGIWQGESALAYAYPTYEGSGPKTDLPAAEAARIASANRDAAREDQPVTQRAATGAGMLLLAACPLPGPLDGVTAWAMLRVRAVAGLGSLQAGLGVLLALVAGMSLWLARLALGWRRSLRAMERALRAHRAGALPELRPTGERELDRVVSALNEAGRRLAESRAHADALALQVAASERLAALGRVAAGVAHEVRNPLAAMRIRAESARHGDDARRRRAIEVILDQVARLDRLVSSLLAMTQRPVPRPRAVALPALLESIAAEHRAQAGAAGVALRVEAGGHATLDPELLGRALGNLVLNAVQHTPPGGTVTLSVSGAASGSAREGGREGGREGDREGAPESGREDRREGGPEDGHEGGRVRLVVADTGPGVAPGLRATLFEPFVTGRAGGTGLGLAIARELVDAMGGRLTLLPDAAQEAQAERDMEARSGTEARPGTGAGQGGARFLVDLPAGA